MCAALQPEVHESATNRSTWAIIWSNDGSEDFNPLWSPLVHAVQSNKVYQPQEVLLVSTSMVSRLINAIR